MNNKTPLLDGYKSNQVYPASPLSNDGYSQGPDANNMGTSIARANKMNSEIDSVPPKIAAQGSSFLSKGKAGLRGSAVADDVGDCPFMKEV